VAGSARWRRGSAHLHRKQLISSPDCTAPRAELAGAARSGSCAPGSSGPGREARRRLLELDAPPLPLVLFRPGATRRTPTSRPPRTGGTTIGSRGRAPGACRSQPRRSSRPTPLPLLPRRRTAEIQGTTAVQRRRRGGAPLLRPSHGGGFLSPSRRHLFLPLLATMARSSNCRSRGGATQCVAHILERAGFGASGLETGHPVARSAPRYGRENAKRVRDRPVAFF
jgi:hypothetical protein